MRARHDQRALDRGQGLFRRARAAFRAVTSADEGAGERLVPAAK